MGGVALRFCLVLGRVLMVVYCCGSGCFGCVWTHLLQMQPGRCLGNVITFLLGLQKATLGSFRGWCGAAFLSGFGACSDGGLLLRKRLLWMRLDPSSPDLQMQSGRCLGSVITSSFRASESNVRQFSWVVWRCVFVWFWGVF